MTGAPSAPCPLPGLDPAARAVAEAAAARIVAVPDFPEPGVLFQDLTPMLSDPVVLRNVVGWLAGVAGDVTAVAGVEARGFVLGTPVALALGLPFVPVRKAGKLPRAVYAETYDLEYGSATLALHVDALAPEARVLVVDDVLATGGTAAASCRLVERAGATVGGVGVLLEIPALRGRDALVGRTVHALLAT